MFVIDAILGSFAIVGAISAGKFVGRQIVKAFSHYKQSQEPFNPSRVPVASTEELEYEPLYVVDKN